MKNEDKLHGEKANAMVGDPLDSKLEVRRVVLDILDSSMRHLGASLGMDVSIVVRSGRFAGQPRGVVDDVR